MLAVCQSFILQQRHTSNTPIELGVPFTQVIEESLQWEVHYRLRHKCSGMKDVRSRLIVVRQRLICRVKATDNKTEYDIEITVDPATALVVGSACTCPVPSDADGSSRCEHNFAFCSG